ncbi:DUF1801 domain-containing protein [Shimazuella alba]|uniref:DUF1801 domain-containing protein n=1 Tax=Shimazuella alba TaxID=2690964 RepID=A0A6I4VPF7_9BACL|nr:DUF1801 domain-containing protein [Shimazuella alba]
MTEYIHDIEEAWQVEVCNQIRQVIHKAIPEMEEQIKYKQAFYTLNGEQICVFFPAKNWVNMTIFHAVNLEAPTGFFEKGAKPERKAIKIRKDKEFDYDLLGKLLQQAAQDI